MMSSHSVIGMYYVMLLFMGSNKAGLSGALGCLPVSEEDLNIEMYLRILTKYYDAILVHWGVFHIAAALAKTV